MYTSDQSPEEKQHPAHGSPAEGPLSQDPQAGAGRRPDGANASTVGDGSTNDEQIRQGLVYPPPPSFYQNAAPNPEQIPPPRPVSPPPSVFHAPPSPGGRNVPPGPFQGSMPGGYPGQQPFYPYPYPPPAVKKSYTWVWILVSVLVLVILGSCGLCAWAGYSLFGDTVRQATSIASDSRDITNNYYQAIQDKNYTQAYNTYINPGSGLNNLTVEQFTQQAQQQDEKYGPVLSYTPGTPSSFSSSSAGTITGFTIPVEVSRSHNYKYTVTLTMRKVANQWKIVNFDRI